MAAQWSRPPNHIQLAQGHTFHTLHCAVWYANSMAQPLSYICMYIGSLKHVGLQHESWSSYIGRIVWVLWLQLRSWDQPIPSTVPASAHTTKDSESEGIIYTMDHCHCWRLHYLTMLTAWTQYNASWPSLQLARAVHVFHLTCHHPDSFFTVTCTTAPSGTDISSSSSASWSSVTTKLSVEDKVHTQCISNMHIHACKHVHTHAHIAYTTCTYVHMHTHICTYATH